MLKAQVKKECSHCHISWHNEQSGEEKQLSAEVSKRKGAVLKFILGKESYSDVICETMVCTLPAV